MKSIYKTILLTLLGAVIIGCTPHSSEPIVKEPSYELTEVARSTGNITISWPKADGTTLDYTISVYGDANLTELKQQYTLLGSNCTSNRFSIPFLDCVNEYYVQVEGSDRKFSAPLRVALEESIPRRNILSQNFDKLCWGYDYINSACGIRLNNDVEQRLSYYSIESLADSREDCHEVHRIDDEGGLLFGCNASLREMMELAGWSGTKANIYIRPGYVKLGNAYTTSCKLTSPKFSEIAEGESATVELSLDACLYSADLSDAQGSATVSLVKGDGTALWSQNLVLDTQSSTPKWKSFAFTIDGVTSDCCFEISIGGTTKQICFDNLEIVRQINIPDTHIYGYVTDRSTGEPIANVAISDGFSVVATDSEGFYSMEPHEDSWYVFYSLPAEYKITMGGNGAPKFFTRRTSDVREYNFTLRKNEEGKEQKFALITMADPQVSSKTKLSRFNVEAVPGIAKHVQELKDAGIPCYGITLGDIISNSSASNSTQYMEQMLTAMHYKTIGLPVYQVMGNHDACWFNEANPVEPDKTSSSFEVKAQRIFETTFGPINYSFNRGDFHIVGMRDIVYRVNDDMGSYATGFLPEQYEWLKQDLALVPKDKIVLLCVHIPLRNSKSSTTYYVKQVHQLLNEFREAHIISGHTHLQNNFGFDSTYKKVYEHNMGTVCGTWWASNVCCDGTPNGFGVFIGENGEFSDWYYKGYTKGMDSRDYQMRLYRGNAITGAEIDDNKNGQEGYYAFNFDDNVIIANIFNADTAWKIEVYEDGEYSGNMSKLADKSYSFSKLTGNYTKSDPRRLPDGVAATYDMWVVGYHLGVMDRMTDGAPSNGSWTLCRHLYKYTLKNKSAKVKVIATDRFGRRYECSEFTDYRNNDLAARP